jgi:prolyl oligopeptidase
MRIALICSCPAGILFAALATFLLDPSLMANDRTYPETRVVNLADDHHGTLVADPYRWLEDDVRVNPEVREWVTAQNEVTNRFLEAIPARATILRELTDLWNYAKSSPPARHGKRYFFFRNDGLQNQNVLVAQDTLDAEPTVILDPNTWSADGTTALAGTSFSPDGRYLAYGVQEAGSDWRTWKILDLETGDHLSDQLRWIKFVQPSWLKDNSGFVYSRYPEPAEDGEFQSLNLNQKVYLHRLRTAQTEDLLVHERPDHPEWGFGADVSDDGKLIVITAWIGTDDRYMVFYKRVADLAAPATHLVGEFDHEYSFLGNDGEHLYFKTDQAAPRKRIVAIELGKPDPANWREIVPEQGDVLEGVKLLGETFITDYLHDAVSRVRLFRTSGAEQPPLELPGLGSAGDFTGERTDSETFYQFSSFATPPSVFRYDLKTGETRLIRRANVDVNPDEFVVRQVFVNSTGGARVPMFIAHRKDLDFSQPQPTLLYGYGGFSISLTPGFSVSRVLWMKHGGVFALANLRGGGEYGEDWHRAGTKLNKQNVFDDFQNCASWLIDQKITSPQKLAIQGGSNGGLLVGACMTQRPDLYAACLPAVGVMDMLRFHRFTAGRFWVDDYGSADNADEFQALLRYSPYHNLRGGTHYPATLITTADTDDRVVPGHSFKFAARLQACQAGPAPTLIRIETRAGHGAGKPTSKIIEEIADQFAFLVKVLHMDWQ